jgi:hypothetical protein
MHPAVLYHPASAASTFHHFLSTCASLKISAGAPAAGAPAAKAAEAASIAAPATSSAAPSSAAPAHQAPQEEKDQSQISCSGLDQQQEENRAAAEDNLPKT